MKCQANACTETGEHEYLMTVKMETRKGEDLYGEGTVTVNALLCGGHFRNVGTITSVSLPEPGEMT